MGGIDGGASDAVVVLLEELAHAVALGDRVAFLEEREAELVGEVRVTGDKRFVPEGVGFKLGECDVGVGAEAPTGVEVEMRIGVVGDGVPGAVPLRDEIFAFGTVDALAADKESRLQLSRRAREACDR